ncbi:hypothetical protein CROQUDRAFT_722847 [Cronartium quercuum f. sp. fusiforme G11]|uniref:Uncharacterized protein n=1 Tax=Cronartium quercuum f. sp. fusiforme G11 TaxID=708437 RepID=A0A9P6TC95_9BASI|nr:hypothetical protein CROQUDRAFT_722847 [Cronartium quercuum f. sp. fusiforme G11]
MAPSSTSQKRKRRRRGSSVFSTDSQTRSIRQPSVRPADDELALAKAAAMKLLDNSCGHIPDLTLDVSTSPVSSHVHDHEPSPRPPKKIRFQDPTQGPSELTLTNNPSPEIVSTTVESDKDTFTNSRKTKKGSSGSSLLRQCIDPRRKSQDEPALKVYEDNGQTFITKAKDIFAENSIIDAFQASLTEFHFYHRDRVASAKSAWSVVPLTELERRSASSLYYGTPPPVLRKKQASARPKLGPFLPPLRTSSEATLVPASAPRQASPIFSDLDMEEYIEMFGDLAPPAAIPQSSTIVVSDNEEAGLCATKESTTPLRKTSVDLDSGQTEDREMSISRDTSPSPSPIPFIESTLSTTASTTRTTPVPHSLPNVEASPSAALASSLSQTQLLTNALNAQYWAGYYTALYHKSIEIALPNIPPAEGASAIVLPCPSASIDKTGWEAGKKAASRALQNPS